MERKIEAARMTPHPVEVLIEKARRAVYCLQYGTWRMGVADEYLRTPEELGSAISAAESWLAREKELGATERDNTFLREGIEQGRAEGEMTAGRQDEIDKAVNDALDRVEKEVCKDSRVWWWAIHQARPKAKKERKR